MASDSVPTIDEDLSPICSFAEALQDPVIITTSQLDLPGPEIVYVNPAFSQITGYAYEEVVGRTPRFLQGEGTDRAVLDSLRQALADGQSFFGRILNYAKDGRKLVFEWYISPWHDAHGTVTHWVSVQRAVEDGEKLHRKLAVALIGIQSVPSVGFRKAILAVDRQAEIRVAADPESLGAESPIDLILFEPKDCHSVEIEELGALRGRFPDTPVIAYLPKDNVELMRALMNRSVRAVIVPSTRAAVVPEVIRIVLAGGLYVPWDSTYGVSRTTEPAASAARPAKLTRRQSEILQLIGKGLSNAEIATALRLNPNTVKGHITKLLKALGLKNRTQAALLASRNAEEPAP